MAVSARGVLVQEGVLADPQASGMAGVPVRAAVVMLAVRLAGIAGVLAAGLAEHAPAAQVVYHVRALGSCASWAGLPGGSGFR